MEDQATFIEALFNLKLFHHSATLADMINLDISKKFGKEAGMGIFHYSLGGKSFYGHGGFYGSLLLYCPEEKVTLVINIGQANAEIDPIKTVENIVEVTLGVETPTG